MFTRLFSTVLFLVSIVAAQCNFTTNVIYLRGGVLWYDNIYIADAIRAENTVRGLLTMPFLFTCKDSPPEDLSIRNDVIRCYAFYYPCANYTINNGPCNTISNFYYVTFPNKKYVVIFADLDTNCYYFFIGNYYVCETKTVAYLFDSTLSLLQRQFLPTIENPYNMNLGATITYPTNNSARLLYQKYDADIIYNITVNPTNNTFTVNSTKVEVKDISRQIMTVRVKQTKLDRYNLIGKKVQKNHNNFTIQH